MFCLFVLDHENGVGVVPSAWVLEQDGIWKTATVESYLMSNSGERESFLTVSP